MNNMKFTFTPAELRQLLEQTLSNYRACESVYDFSPDAMQNTIGQTLAGLAIAQAEKEFDAMADDDTKRLENSLPYLDEDAIPSDGSDEDTFDWPSVKDLMSHEFCPNCGSSDLYMNTCFACGQNQDNISPEAIGLESPF